MNTSSINARDLTLAIALALAAPARAAVVSYTAPAATRGDASDRNVLPGFDDALGTLTGASLSFSGDISGRASAPIAITRPETVTVSPYFILGGLAEFGRNLRVDLPSLSAVPTYAATGGYSLTWSATVEAAAVDLTLSAFGGEGDVVYTLAGGYDLRPNPATFYDNGAPFSGTTTVTYTYTPVSADSPGASVAPVQDVPEPASFAALGLGLLGLAATRRRAA